MEKKLYDLTAPQKSILLTEQYFKGSSINNICGTAIIDEKIDFNLLKKAINIVIKNHDSFNFKLTLDNNEMKQYLDESNDIDVEIIDIDNKDDIATIENNLMKHVFDIYNSDLFCFKIFRFKDNTGGFMLNIHHLFADSWTLGVTAKDIVRVYSCLLNGEEVTKNDDFSYMNYIYSEKEYLSSDKFTKDKEYWNTMFETVPEQATIPGSINGANDNFSCTANRHTFNVDINVMNRINEFCKINRVSVFNFFMSIYSIYISRVSGLDDFVIGTPILNRTTFNEKNTTGMFINTAPLRINLNNILDFKSFVSNIAKDSLGMLRHQKYYYQNIIEDLRKKNSNLPNLYNILVSYQVTKANTEKGLNYTTRWAFNGNTADDLDIHLFDINDTGSIDIAYDYKLSKYTDNDIVCIHNRIMNIVEQVISCDNIALSDIEIVTEEEKNQILYEFNNTDAEYDKDSNIIELIENICKDYPNKIAIKFENDSITYYELWNRINQAANYLISHIDITTNSNIGIFTTRSIDTIIGILSIIRINCTYVPIDPEYPIDRINYMIEKSSITTILSADVNLKNIVQNFDINFVPINYSNYTNISNTFELKPTYNSNNNLYIIFTSGSTGKPKGVTLSHKNMINLISFEKYNTNIFQNDIDHKILQFATMSFDVSYQEIFSCLLSASTLVLVKDSVRKNMNSLTNYIVDNNINILFVPPAYLRLLCEDDVNIERLCSCVKHIITAGEALVITDGISKLLKNNITIHNHYGPAETHVATTYTLNSNYTENNVPIGYPINNTYIYILDSGNNLCPINTIGQIAISGDCVGNGYFNNDDLTSTKFIENPFFLGKSMYLTGDLGFWDNSGCLHYVGRSDFQVKINGFRIELSEIDKVLSKHSSILNCISTIQEKNNKKYIITYCICNNILDEYELKSYLKNSLPNYMIPNKIIQLDALPINANGKIDRKNLPEVDFTNFVEDFIEPSTNTELKLANIWKKIFNLDNVGANYDFFEIGGDSLLAIKLVSIVKDEFNVDITVANIFDFSTLKDLANFIDSCNVSKKDNTISKAADMSYYPLSSAQKRIYYACKIAEDKGIVYNIPGGMLVNSILDSKKIEDAFKKLIELHSSFRTCFKIIDNDVRQIVLDKIDFHIEVNNSKEADLDNIVNSFPRAFNFETAPLLRVSVHYLDNKKTLILIDSHHIIIDGTSLNILIRDFCKLYNNTNIEKSSLEYIDYAVWENNYINSSDIKNNENYWLNNFKDTEIPVINLPYDYSIPMVSSYAGDKISTTIPNDIFANIDSIAKEIGCSSYMLFLATFYVLLYKYTFQDNIIVGSPIANRDFSNLQNILGMFVNNIALNGHIDSSKTFKEFLKDIKTLVLDALANQPYPYDLLVKNLNLNNKNLFDVMFTYQNMQKEKLTIENNELDIIEAKTKTSKFNLSLEIIPYTNTLNLEYRTDLFEQETVNRILNHYINLLNNISANMNTKIGDISILSEEERNMILYDFNNTKMDYPKDKTIAQLFEEQVNKTPDNIAVVFEDKKLTYKELNEKANSLAWYLRKNNIGRNDIIAIMMNRSLELMVSIIGVLKSGACYIPIDPNFPKDRTEYMLKNSNSKLLLTDNALYQLIDFDNKLLIDLSNYSFDVISDNLVSINQPDDISYIIYTSGSTGKPKGVVLKQSSLVNLTYYLNNYVDFLKNNSNIAMASVTTASFDIFIFETLIVLQKGIKVVIANEDEQRLPDKLNVFLQKNNIKAIQMTPSRMRMFLDNISSCPNLANLDYVVLAGEPLPDVLLNDLLALGIKKVYNGYGPSETTVFSTFTDVTNYTHVNIGKPLANTQMYILDKDLCPVPIGISGELFISGDGVGKGYLNNETITKEKFIINPFNGNVPMYRTGDVCKFLENGEITYIERLDNQVKIRGLRIELGEIENKLLEVPLIKKVKVIKQSIQNRDFLSAYYVATTDLKANELRKFLSKSLPDYMIPSYFTALDDFPYTPNGKIDKNALPLPNISMEGSEITYIAPKSEIEIKLISILENLLKVSPIGMNDNFFNLGGDSLTAILLCTNIKKTFNVDLSFKDIINNPIVADLANCILNTTSTNKTCSIKQYEKREFYPVSSAQKRMYLSSSIDNNSTLYNITGGILLDSMPDIDKLQKAFDTIVARHDSLRTYFDVIDGNIVQKIADNIELKLVIENVDTNNIDTLFEKYQTIFNLNKAPLFKTYLLKLPNKKVLLILDVHHSIFDGTSLNNFIQELSDAYNGIALPKLPISYKDFAVWEKEQLLNDGFKDSKSFWIEQYSGDIPLLNMPTTYTRPATKSYDGHTFVTYISKEITSKINEFAVKYNVTPYMLMLSIYYILLYKYTGQEDIIVGSPISGRPYEELESLLGMFVNSLPLRNTVSANVDFEEFLSNVKNSCINAFSHQDYPFDMLVNDLNIARDNSRSPLFDTMFIYQNNGLKTMNFDGINATYCLPKNHTAKFDLSMEVSPQNEVLKLSFEYCTKLFDEDFITKLSSHYNNILNAILENPNIKIADIDILSDEERHQILYEFNDTKTDYPSDKTIATLFEEQVEKTPNNVALVFEDKKLTYKELNEKANQLAWYLNENGVNRGDIVGISLNRSLELIVCMIAVLKTGAAYLPIDPTYPKGRIDYIIKDSNIKVLLTKENLLQNFINFPCVFTVDFESSPIFKESSKNALNITTSPDDLAYLIYTSGSTGNPKGVMVTNRNVNNFIIGASKKINFKNYSTIVSVTTMCFDIFVLETLLPLELGLTIVLASDEEQNMPALLNKICINNNVEMLQTTPSRMDLLTSDSSNLEYIKNLKCIMLGGEPCNENILLKLRKLSNAKIFNMYGPTETTVWSTIKDITNSNQITIGKPIANTQIYILNMDMNIVPIGLPGDLYIGGIGVSQGYLNREKLTNEKFIKNPFIENDIIYNTGDLASWTPNGELNCLGRSDFQVKIRGLRIELEEIEKQILKYPNISNAIVCVKNDSLNRQFLCGYFISSSRISISDLKDYLGQFLPNYMVPAFLIQLDDFKYTPNGKVDRKTLPLPKTNNSEEIISPETPTETKLVGLFEKLLCISPISITDNFFEIGGDSILALKLQIELLNNNMDVSYADIFKYSTVKDLALKIDASNTAKPSITDSDYDDNLNKILQKNTIDNISLNYKPLGNVLLTGATGFLGAHILDNILTNTNANIYCLVRKDPGISVIDKFLKKIHYYFGNKYDSLIDKKIFVIESDVVREDLGLSTHKIAEIFDNIQCVINSVAIVKHYGYYSEFERVNVNAVKNLVKYCEQFNKKFIQISTISVSGNTLTDLEINNKHSSDNIYFYENCLYVSQSLDNVYVKSKYEAEKFILKEMYYNSLDALILRIGNITNRFSDGLFQPNAQDNAFMHRMKALIDFKVIPDYLFEHYLEFSPVDYVADAVVRSVEYINNDINVLHIYNQNHLFIKDLLLILSDYNIKIVANTEFQNIIKSSLSNSKKRNSLSYIINDFDKNYNLIYNSNIKIKNDFSRTLLSKTGFNWPIIDKEYIDKLLKHY